MLWIWNKWFAYLNFSGKDDAILLQNSSFRELQILTELIFRYKVDTVSTSVYLTCTA